jgi:hypothetical protein
MTLDEIKYTSDKGTLLTPVIRQSFFGTYFNQTIQKLSLWPLESYRSFVAVWPVSFCPSLLEHQQL